MVDLSAPQDILKPSLPSALAIALTFIAVGLPVLVDSAIVPKPTAVTRLPILKPTPRPVVINLTPKFRNISVQLPHVNRKVSLEFPPRVTRTLVKQYDGNLRLYLRSLARRSLAKSIAVLKFDEAKQLGIETVDGFISKVLGAFGAANTTVKPRLVKRDIFTDIACGAFAGLALPAFLTAAGWFSAANDGSRSLTTDQKWFLYPLHGSLVTTVNLNIFYSATFPPGFGGAAATTMNRNIYVKNPRTGNPPSPLPNSLLGSAFGSQVVLLAHEIVHVGQYRADNWNLAEFGLEYMFQYCKAGFSYENNALEKQAYTRQELVKPLLKDTRWYTIWKKVKGATKLGYPANLAPTVNPSYSMLVFQKGSIQIKTNSNCYRIFVGADFQAQNAAQCGKLKVIKGKPCLKDPEPPACDPEYVQEKNALCQQRKAAYAALAAKKPWICN